MLYFCGRFKIGSEYEHPRDEWTDSYPWDAADYLESKEDIAAYQCRLEVALEDGDPDLMVAVLEDTY